MRSRRVLLIALAVVASAALVQATHNFGHRLYIVGQTVDADGYPLANTRLEGELEGLQPELNEGPCRSNPCQTQTDARGHFGQNLYWHGHGIGESGTAIVRVGGESFQGPFDTDTRFTVVNAQLSTTVNHSASTWQSFNRSYVVHGMLFVPGGNPPDSQTTWPSGSPPGCQPENRVSGRCGPVTVNVTLELTDGTTLEQSTRTNPGYGIFRVNFEANQSITGGTGTIEALDESWSFDVDPTYQATSGVWKFEEQGGLDEFPVVPILVVVGLIGGGGALYVGAQKWRSKRELERAREESSRKRSNE